MTHISCLFVLNQTQDNKWHSRFLVFYRAYLQQFPSYFPYFVLPLLIIYDLSRRNKQAYEHSISQGLYRPTWHISQTAENCITMPFITRIMTLLVYCHAKRHPLFVRSENFHSAFFDIYSESVLYQLTKENMQFQELIKVIRSQSKCDTSRLAL